MKKYLNNVYRPAMLGTAIEYYDVSLYGYLAPILIEVFLPNLDKTFAYFCYFFFEVFAALCQLSGAYIFGRIGDQNGRKTAIYYSMIGTSVITFITCALPTYDDVGVYAVIGFALCRALQSFFLGGEFNGGAIYCLEHETNINKHGSISGLYGALAVMGAATAAITVTLIMFFGKEYFRIAYAISLIFTIITYFMRRNMVETPDYIASRTKTSIEIPKSIKSHIFLTITFASLFCGVLYGLPTRIFNIIIPMATNIDTTIIMSINSFILIIYMILLLSFGIASNRYKPSRVMQTAALATIILSVPAVLLLENQSIACIIGAKLIFCALAAAFIGPFHAWAQSLSVTSSRYTQIATAYSLGKLSALFILALSIPLYKYFDSLLIIALILIFASFLALKRLKSVSAYSLTSISLHTKQL